jgi:arylsulfatase A-like enzyme
MASILDVAPTLLDAAGIEEPEGVQGCSLREALRGDAIPSRTAALTENDDDFVPMKMRVLTTMDWKLVYYCGEEFGELYDRRNDPDEMVNLWNDAGYAPQRAELKDMLLEEVMCSLDVSNGRRQSPHPLRAIKWTPRHR